MNNLLLNLFMYLFKIFCGYIEPELVEPEFDNETKSYEPYFLYDLETFESSPLYQ